VATFDFDFRYTDDQAPIVVVCLGGAARRARQLGIKWTWRHLGPRLLRVTVDGNSRKTDLLFYRLERDLPLLAEGCDHAPFPPGRRAKIGRGVAEVTLRGADVRSDDTQTLRGVSATALYFLPYDYECPTHPVLDARLRITADLIVSWNFGEVAAEVLLEELHTACELVLDEAVNPRSKRLSFAELVDGAAQAGLLRPDEFVSDPVELLTELKDLRKNVRHRAAEGSSAWLSEHWEHVAITLERLVSALNRSRSSL
jgi:hypothetical protein